MGAEARLSPRYSRQLDVNVDGLEIHTTNVALGGVQLCCPQMRFHGFQRAEKNGEIALQIRSPGTQDSFKVTGRVRYANPTDDEYLIGFEFTQIDSGTKKRWSEYIRTLADSESNT